MLHLTGAASDWTTLSEVPINIQPIPHQKPAGSPGPSTFKSLILFKTSVLYIWTLRSPGPQSNLVLKQPKDQQTPWPPQGPSNFFTSQLPGEPPHIFKECHPVRGKLCFTVSQAQGKGIISQKVEQGFFFGDEL